MYQEDMKWLDDCQWYAVLVIPNKSMFQQFLLNMLSDINRSRMKLIEMMKCQKQQGNNNIPVSKADSQKHLDMQ